MTPSPAKQGAATRDLRHRVLTCMTKLSDRDTHSQAVSELQSIIPTLTTATFPLFINSLSSTSSADRPVARSAAIRLLADLSTAHGPSLSPHFPKLISAVVRRLRDPNSAVRSSAAAAAAAFSANIPSSSSAIVRTLSDSLSTEQDHSAQSSAALCLSAALDASPELDAFQIVKLLPKWMKLLRCDGFKAKSSLLVLVRSAVRVCEVGNCNLLRDLVNCLVEFLKCEDWTARKASAEALKDIAVMERNSLSELKAGFLKAFESRKFDKVKAVREAMTQMMEVWKEIPDEFCDGSPLPQASYGESASDGCCPARSKISSEVDSNTPQTKRKHFPLKRTSPSDTALKTTAGNSDAVESVRRKSSPLENLELDSRKPSGRNLDPADFFSSSVTPAYEDNPVGDYGVQQRAAVKLSKPGTKCSLFCKNPGSCVVPYPEEHPGATVVVSNTPADTCRHDKDCEDLLLIRNQLVQIENQQSSLMNLLQKFIGSSQDGMRSIETRVHGLELAIDDMSYDLAISTARMPTSEPSRTSCCFLPGSEFLSSKFWRRPDGRCSTSRLSLSGSTPSVSAMHNLTQRSPAGEKFKLENRRLLLRSAGGVIVNPLAETRGKSRKISEASSSNMLSVHNVG